MERLIQAHTVLSVYEGSLTHAGGGGTAVLRSSNIVRHDGEAQVCCLSLVLRHAV